ncbi:MAG TPA: GAF domain-containing protein, partial [Myxococcota bacterium]|nr:GAF domain-containing protein [Myxococcota bacterium]
MTAVEVNLKFVGDVVSSIKVGEHGVAYALDRTGTLITHPDISLVLKKSDLSALPQVAALSAAPSRDAAAGGATVASALGRDLRGQEVFSARAPIPMLQWNVFVESPRDEALAPLYATIARAASVLAAGLVVSVVASFFVARALVRPLRALQEGAERIGAGELDRRIEVKTGDELEGLADRFNAMAGALKESYTDLEHKVEARTAELTEALDRQTATSEVLSAISEAQTDATAVFQTIARNAQRLSGALACNVLLYDGKLLRMVACHGFSPEQEDGVRRKYPAEPGDDSLLSGRVVASGRTEYIEDVLADPAYDREHAAVARWRRMLGVPMVREGAVQGVIVLAWREPGRTPQPLVDLLRTFADQAVIAIENVRLFNETKEALERQTATSEVLSAISEAQTDATAVFETIARNAHRLSGSVLCNVLLYDGKLLHIVASAGFSPEQEQELRRKYPVEAGDASVLSGRVVLSGRTEHIEDSLADPLYDREHAAVFGSRRMLGVPMVREGAVQGVIVLAWRSPGQTPPALVDLLKTFADQAVIAIENVRLFNETKEALERQTATAEILQVISGSVSDATPVFEKILQSCSRLFESTEQGVLVLGDDGRLYLGAHHGVARERLEPLFPVSEPAGMTSSILQRNVLHYRDVLADADVPPGIRAVAKRIDIGPYSQVFVPMVWEGRAIGSLYVTRQPPTGFSEKEIGLLRTFADQAVIAIQNARLFRETREALDRQTATSEVLRVISESPTDVQPVFEAIANSGVRLFEGAAVAVSRPDGGLVRCVAIAESDEARAARWRDVFPFPLERSYIHGAAMLDCRAVDVADVLETGGQFEAGKRNLAPAGYRAMTVVPMVRDQVAIGAIAVVRVEPGPLSTEQIALLKTFADQAVIAIENVRLFNETKEALERQTATAEVLRVISRSVADSAPVFHKILERCAHLFSSSEQGIMLVGEDDRIHLGAHRGPARERFQAMFPRVRFPGFERQVLHCPDVLGDPEVPRPVRRFVESLGIGNLSVVFVPMLWDDRPTGVLYVVRQPPVGFSPKEIDLVRTFADQAVIAIQNARLFNETREALEQQTATAEILQVISRSVADSQPVFDAILRSCERLFNGAHMGITLLGDDERVHLRAHRGPIDDRSDFARNFPFPLGRDSGSGSAMLTREVIAYEDVQDLDVPAVVKASSAAA